MVLKDAIFNLYQRKIPAESRIARNAMYRHMWSFFKDDKISAFQSNYREYIKGIKLITGAPGQEQPLAYDGFEKVNLIFFFFFPFYSYVLYYLYLRRLYLHAFTINEFD